MIRFKFKDRNGKILFYTFDSVSEARHFAKENFLHFLGIWIRLFQKEGGNYDRKKYLFRCRTEIFCNTPDEYNDLCCEYDLEDCGMSGKYVGSSWSHDDKNNVDVYYRQKVGGNYVVLIRKRKRLLLRCEIHIE